jgi:tRNA modification GTPase
MSEDTIVAVATPPGRGGVAIVRLSGPIALSIAQSITHKKIITPRTAHFCSLYRQDKSLLDEGLLIYFKAPHSFTGEDIIEFQVHGAPIVLDEILKESIICGARLARPGEYSERAFLNDKMDLTQAEAIADLIQASSQTAARMAVRSLQGDFSKKINALSQQIIRLRLFVEAAIDFPEEEIDFLSDGKVASQLSAILVELNVIQKSATQGAIIREGLSVVIAGRPNAGKSTLINALAGRDVAIVTAIPGTTRDVMREHVLLDDIPLYLIDTAGLRDSDDEVEQEGIKRAWQEVSRADCLLMVTDGSEPDVEATPLNEAIRSQLPAGIPLIHVLNKIDQKRLPAGVENNRVSLSAKSGEGLSLLKEKIKEVVGYQVGEGQFLARRRHIQALSAAQKLLASGQQQLLDHRAGELLAEDLRLAHDSLCEITGAYTSDDLLGEIFSSFCIGK